MTLLLFAKVSTVLLVLFFALVPLAAWLERRQGAFAQDRIGASRASIATATFGGLLQPMADALKLLGKEIAHGRFPCSCRTKYHYYP